MSVAVSPSHPVVPADAVDPVGYPESRAGSGAEFEHSLAEYREAPASLPARALAETIHATMHTVLAVGCHALSLPLPFTAVERAARALPKPRGLRRRPVELPHAHAELIRARGVGPNRPRAARRAQAGRVVLYCHGGAFLCCGISTHLRMIDKLSKYADAPVLAVDYRMLPKHTVRAGLDDCYDGYRWLRGQGYRPDQIVIGGDSAGGYLSLALAQRLAAEGERPAALVLLSPLLQLDADRPNEHGPLLPHHSFAALTKLIAEHDGGLYEPLEHVTADLPPTLIHVSGAEELIHDARQALRKLTAAGVPAQLRVWPGQIHVFQIAAPLVPEATRSLRQIGRYIRTVTGTDATTDTAA